MKDRLVYGIDNYIYGSNIFHKLINNNNIGENGSNLTIMVLIYNRSNNTIDLLKSIDKCIPNFEGEVLLIDNNSDKKDMEKVEKQLKKVKFKNRVIHLGNNYGVAGGRNRGIEFVNTDWVFSLDNDIYLVDNPIPKIDEAIRLLGCHFLNVPLMDEKGKSYFLNGGHLYLDIDLDGLIHIGGGSLYKQEDINLFTDLHPSVSTFFAGGTSVFRKDTFIKLGKYDEGYFIGFEDIDFSLRLFQEGYKIGNCVGNCLIHNHVIDGDKASVEYEKNRFSSEIIYNSAMHFEEKWGYKVWNKNTAMWLKQRQKELNIKNKKNEKETEKNEEEKKKIALVVDAYDWCFYNISTQIKKYLSFKYDIEIIVMDNHNNIYNIFFYLKKFDLAHFFWRGHLLWLNDVDNKVFLDLYGVSYNYFIENVVKKVNITTSVYDHLFLNKDLKSTKKILSYTDKYTVSSNILNSIYKKIKNIPKPTCVITDGVDLDRFYPINNKYDDIANRKIVFGWVGNSAWNGEKDDFKGFNTIIKPALEELKEEGYQVEWSFADKQIKQIPFDKMNDYYNSIDVLLCASKAEGTPNPVLEAMATGTVIISTNVGIVPDALGEMQKEYILEERTKDCLKKKIAKLLDEKKQIKSLSMENLERIKSWSWKNKVQEFDDFFNKNM